MTPAGGRASQASLTIAGEELIADISGVLLWPARGLAAVADLHLEKAAALNRRRGGVLPPHDTAATLERLAATLQRLAPARVVALGDSFHDSAAASRLPDAARQRLAALTATYDWLWLTGNHDTALPAWLGGAVSGEHREGSIVFRHQARPGATDAGELSGHFHPQVRVAAGGRRLRRPCFCEDGRRCILPAFGSATGGLDARDPAIARLLASQHRVHALGHRRLHTVPVRAARAPA